jgi:hypothetical protein
MKESMMKIKLTTDEMQFPFMYTKRDYLRDVVGRFATGSGSVGAADQLVSSTELPMKPTSEELESNLFAKPSYVLAGKPVQVGQNTSHGKVVSKHGDHHVVHQLDGQYSVVQTATGIRQFAHRDLPLVQSVANILGRGKGMMTCRVGRG